MERAEEDTEREATVQATGDLRDLEKEPGEGKVMAVAEDRKEAVLGTGVVGVGWVV